MTFLCTRTQKGPVNITAEYFCLYSALRHWQSLKWLQWLIMNFLSCSSTGKQFPRFFVCFIIDIIISKQQNCCSLNDNQQGSRQPIIHHWNYLVMFIDTLFIHRPHYLFAYFYACFCPQEKGWTTNLDILQCFFCNGEQWNRIEHSLMSRYRIQQNLLNCRIAGQLLH